MVITLLQCGSESDCVKSERCAMEPETGPCYAIITKYYYDKTEKKCNTFTWGGCAGVVPFNTLEECENSCGCDE